MDVHLKLDAENPLPLFQQIVNEIEALVITGILKSGESLPSIRDLAVEHSINPNTVSKAYQLLQSMKLIEPIRGLGLKVCKLDTKIMEQRRGHLLNNEVKRLVGVAKTFQITPSELIRLVRSRWKE